MFTVYEIGAKNLLKGHVTDCIRLKFNIGDQFSILISLKGRTVLKNKINTLIGFFISIYIQILNERYKS